MLDDRHELHVTAPQAFQELVNLQSAALAVLVDRGHRVERDPALLQPPQARHHAVEGGSPGLVLPVPVVDVLRSVDRDADQKIIPAEKLGPFRRNERPVRLEGVMDDLSVGILLFELQGLPVEIQAEHQRLAAVPVEGHLGHVVGPDVFPDDRFQHLQAHPRLASAVDFRLVQVVAVLAVQVAQRTARLQHDVEGHRPVDAQGVFERECVLERFPHDAKILVLRPWTKGASGHFF